MNTVYVVEHGLLLEGQESWGISIALVAKHRRKDQLIDKILIRPLISMTGLLNQQLLLLQAPLSYFFAL